MIKQQLLKYHFLLFLMNPFVSLLVFFRNYRDKNFVLFVTLSISFLGFTTLGVGDLESYQQWFYERHTSLNMLIHDILSLNIADYYVHMLQYLVGIFTDSHKIYFAFLFGVFGFFYSNILNELFKLIPEKTTRFTLIVLAAVLFYYSIRLTLSMRFYTGALFYILMIMRYVVSSNKNYLIYAAFAPFFHIGLLAATLSIPLIYLLTNRHNWAMILVVVSYFIGQSTIVDIIEQQSQEINYGSLDTRVRTYVSDEGRLFMENVYREGAERANWKLTLLTTVREYVWYLINIGILILFYYKRRMINNNLTSSLFSIILVNWAVANILLNISNGDRYMIIYTFLSLCLFLILYNRGDLPILFKNYILIMSPIVLIYDAMLLYAANPLFNYEFFYSNYVLEMFIE